MAIARSGRRQRRIGRSYEIADRDEAAAIQADDRIGGGVIGQQLSRIDKVLAATVAAGPSSPELPAWADSQSATLAALALCSQVCNWAAWVGSKLLPSVFRRSRLSRAVKSLALICTLLPLLSQNAMSCPPEAFGSAPMLTTYRLPVWHVGIVIGCTVSRQRSVDRVDADHAGGSRRSGIRYRDIVACDQARGCASECLRIVADQHQGIIGLDGQLGRIDGEAARACGIAVIRIATGEDDHHGVKAGIDRQVGEPIVMIRHQAVNGCAVLVNAANIDGGRVPLAVVGKRPAANFDLWRRGIDGVVPVATSSAYFGLLLVNVTTTV